VNEVAAHVDLSGVELIGQFVRLRMIDAEDARVTLEWRLGERAVHLNLGATTVAEQRIWIESRPSNELNFIIELIGGQAVGMLSLIGIDFVHRHAEPARFMIGDGSAVKGVPVAIEAMLLLYKLAFDTLGLERVHGTVASENHMMIKWQKALGMREEGRLRRHYFLDGRFQDAVCLGMLKAEYQSVARPRMTALTRG